MHSIIFKSLILYVALQLVSLTRTTQSHNFIRCCQLMSLDMYSQFSLLKFSFIFSYISFSFKIVINYSRLISMSINAWDIYVSMLLNLLLANVKILSCFSFCFLLYLVIFLIITVVREKIKVKLALSIPNGAPTILVNGTIDIPLLLRLEQLKICLCNQKQ